ncbi:hypothetical protein HU200_012613 [Digitaria exilis]|uniref:VWFA domain-containing protein n=1 Tax=Digitaria exilis TaxID=1010633 RepID=A0A835KN30_9POAL|nr:hypothetical protein HU200_012613 [Digitaria exilis]CAB3486366.1 unnamed protein product [Digitaria exilis]
MHIPGKAVSSVMQLSAFTKITLIPKENKYRDFPVAVRLKAAEMTVRVKPPVDIVAAIDISGSMGEPAGGPSKKKKMVLIEQAMGKVIKNLSGAMNSIAVVTFDDKIRLVTSLEEMTEKGQGIISAAVKDLDPQGETKFQGALKKAATILKDRKDHNDRLAFIIFFSDGEDDKFQVENIKDNLGYPIHAFGFSLQEEKDLTTLKAMADASSGSYTLVNEDLDKITEKLDQLTAERTTSMVAVDTIVHLKTLHPGVFLSKIEGSSDSSNSKISEDKQSADIFVGVISSGEQREFTVFLDVPEGHGNGAHGAMDLLAVAGSYKQSWDRKTVALGESIVTVKRPGPTSCNELHWIKERMEYWCKVKLNLSAMYEKETAEAEAGVKCKCHIQQVLREASLEVINKEMHHDIYTVST